ncbi:MAG: tetratricopeptide repeat protein [Cyanobacterium sp. T60_A2020_053]|nr:tetratricopeptide repeat protein [Cyanobacterium sp. T60_A2020_053]
MFVEIELAIETKNFDQAKILIEKIPPQEEKHLWQNYYYGLIAEENNNIIEAEEKYRQVLKDSIFPNPNIIKRIREGLGRIQNIKNLQKAQEKQSLQQQKADIFNKLKDHHNQDELAVLILKPVSVDDKNNLAKNFAEILELDIYTAKLQIPTRHWRLLKTGKWQELQSYYLMFERFSIPSFCYPIQAINTIQVYQVNYLESFNDKISVICENKAQQVINFTVDINEVSSQVEAMLPIFEMSLHTDTKGKLVRKKTTLDYINFYDLHIKNQNLIIRFNDNRYQFEQGNKNFLEAKTSREKWLSLTKFIQNNLSNITLYSDYTPFAESVVQFPKMLKQIDAKVQLFRKEETLWDEAFQLYSGVVFLGVDGN